MSKLFNIRPRWRNLLLARILLFAISIVLSSSGEDIGPNDTIEESLASPHRFSGSIDNNIRDLQSKSAKSSKSNKSSKSKGSKSKASKISGSKSKSGKASSKVGKSSDKSKSSKSKAAKNTESKSKVSKSSSKIGKSLKSLDSGDDTEKSGDGSAISSSDSIESTNNPLPSEDNELSDSVETSSLIRDDIDYVEEDNSLDSSSYSGSMDTEEAVENIDIITTEEEVLFTKDGKTYAIQLPVSSEDETNIDTTQFEGDFMEERIDESEDIEVDIDEIMTEIIEVSRAFEKEFDESDVDLDPSRESVE